MRLKKKSLINYLINICDFFCSMQIQWQIC